MFGFRSNKKQDDSPPSPNEDNSYIQALHPAPTSDSKPFDETEMNNSSKLLTLDNMSCISEGASSSKSKQRPEECMPTQTQSTKMVNNVHHTHTADCGHSADDGSKSTSTSSGSKSSFKDVIENNMIANSKINKAVQASQENVNKLETFHKIVEVGGTNKRSAGGTKKNKSTSTAKLDDLKVNLDDVLNATTSKEETVGSLDVFSDGHSIDADRSESTTQSENSSTKTSSIKSGGAASSVRSITKSIRSAKSTRSNKSNKSSDETATNKSVPSIQMSEIEASEAYNRICCPPNSRYSPYPSGSTTSSNNEPLKDIRAKYRDQTITPTSLASEVSDSLASAEDSKSAKSNKSGKSKQSALADTITTVDDDNDNDAPSVSHTSHSGSKSDEEGSLQKNNNFFEDAHSVYSAARTERTPRNEKKKKKDDTLKEEEENVVVANFMSESSGQSGSNLRDNMEESQDLDFVHSDEASGSNAQKQQGSSKFSLFKSKQRKSKRFFGGSKKSSTTNVPTDPIDTSTRLCDLPIHVNSIEDSEEVELLYGSVHSLPKEVVDTTKEKKDGGDDMTRVASNQTAPTVETKEELLDDHHQVAPVPLTVSRSEYDDDDGGLFGKLLSCSAIPMMGAAIPKCNDVSATMPNQSVTPSPLVLYNDEEDETLDVEIFEDDNNVTRIGYFKHPTIPVDDEEQPADEQARSNTDNEEVNDTQKMKVTSKIILKTKVVPGFEVLSAPNSDDIVVVDTVSMKIDDIATKLNDRKLSGNLDGSLKSKRGNGLRMKLFKREKDKKNKSKNNKKKKGVLNQLEINHVVEENEGHSEGDVAKEEKGRPELKEECNKMVCGSAV